MYPGRRRNGGTLLAAAIAAAGAAACSASGEGAASILCNPKIETCIIRGDEDGQVADGPAILQPVDGTVSEAGMSRSPLCGLIGCYPGNPSACGATPPSDGGFAHPYAADGADNPLPPPKQEADAASDAATAVDASVDRSPDAGAPADSSAPVTRDASIDAADRADTGASDEPKVPQSCYVKPGDPGVVVAECAPVGAGASGDPCGDSTDCGVGLACVDVNNHPACRPFSCALPAKCLSGSYYQQVPLRVMGATLPDVKVPVCLPNDHCELLKTPSSCPAGQACVVVGEGDTTCMAPGSAKLGDSCDDQTHLCAEGLICAKLMNQCLKICHLDAGPAECAGGGVCQGGNRSVPQGFGICFGGSRDGGF